MKLLRISDNAGQFLNDKGEFSPIDALKKEDLLRLATIVLNEESSELDEYSESGIKNQAHQVIYKSVYQKMIDLKKRRSEFKDEAARKYLESYQRYRSDLTQ